MQKSFRYLVVATVFAFAAGGATSAVAQVKASSGPTSTVVYVSGNDLVVKSADGKLLNYQVPAGTMFSTDGKDVPLSALTPGTKLTKAISTGFDPDIIGAVQVVKGKVFAVTPPDTVTLSLADGIKELKVPEHTKFMVDGKELTIAELKPDMLVQATVVTTVAPDAKPEVANAPAPEAPALEGALLVSKTPGSGDSALPEAGTNLPLYGLLGMILLAMGAGLTFWKRPVRS